MNISLIICSRNRADKLTRCLQTIDARNMLEIGGELILVESASQDHTAEVMQLFKTNAGFPVHIVRMSQPGLGFARNAGLSAARGDILAFTDDDCYLDASYLATLRTIFDSGDFQYCGGRVMLYDPEDLPFTCKESDSIEWYPPASFLAAGTLHGANMVFQRQVIERIGGFDPMFGAGTPFPAEDIEYCARASWAGFTGAYRPELVVYHHHGRKSISSHFMRRAKSYQRGKGAYYTRCLLSGHALYLRKWVYDLLSPPYKIRGKIWSIQGGLHYLSVLLRSKKISSCTPEFFVPLAINPQDHEE